MVLSVGDVWRLYTKTIPNGVKGDKPGALVIRKKGVNRQSKWVIEVNKAFADAAKKCAGKDIRSFHLCIHNEMHGRKFRAG